MNAAIFTEDLLLHDYRAMATTLIRFRILPPLYELNHATIVVPVKKNGRNIKVKFHFKITRSGQAGLMTKGNVKVIGDDIGALHNTIVEAKYPLAVDIGMGATPGGSNEAQQTSTQLLNIILGHYRSVMKLPQIRSVAVKHVAGYEYVQKGKGVKPQVGWAFGGLGLKPDGDDAGLTDGDADVVARVQTGVSAGVLPIWYSLFLDAHAERASNNYRSALAHLYMSFEMLATTMCRVLGTIKLGEAAAEAFLEPASDEEHHPSIYQIVKKTHELYESGPSKTVLEKQTHLLWEHRNDILHGKDFSISADLVDRAFKAYAVLAQWHEEIGKDLASKILLSGEEKPLA